MVIDGSYYVFHRYYATKRWLSLQKEASIEFDDAFFRHLEADMVMLRKRHDIAESEVVWWATDCPRRDIWRMEYYPEYKATRKPAADFDKEIFRKVTKYVTDNAERLNVRQLGHPRLEADDICYILANHLTFDRMVIIANDNDYLQLCSDTVDVVNKEGKRIRERGCGDARKDLLMKILVGDKSDNIPPICSGLGEKTGAKLVAMEPVERDAWIAQRPVGTTDQYEINELIVNMRNVPDEYVREVKKMIEL